jgi:hypothetical protein
MQNIALIHPPVIPHDFIFILKNWMSKYLEIIKKKTKKTKPWGVHLLQ